jgi:hypothetical protein
LGKEYNIQSAAILQKIKEERPRYILKKTQRTAKDVREGLINVTKVAKPLARIAVSPYFRLSVFYFRVLTFI